MITVYLVESDEPNRKIKMAEYETNNQAEAIEKAKKQFESMLARLVTHKFNVTAERTA